MRFKFLVPTDNRKSFLAITEDGSLGMVTLADYPAEYPDFDDDEPPQALFRPIEVTRVVPEA